jgi:hypothetical protein
MHGAIKFTGLIRCASNIFDTKMLMQLSAYEEVNGKRQASARGMIGNIAKSLDCI